jgi:2,3-bisphosphoglycerate-dependent phosphoglycerate mutase
MHKLVLLRHGESLWNLENRFTGWTDVPLTNNGQLEAKNSGKLLKDEKIQFDQVYTSVLKRAIHTMEICLKEMKLISLPIKYEWRLNERHYGSLQGLNKSDVSKKFGEKQVLIWRRSYNISPPPLNINDERHPRFDKKYEKLDSKDMPPSESLKDTVNRFMPLWNNYISKCIKSGKNVLIVAHGNSLRALVKYLDGISENEIINLNIPTGIPLVYNLDESLNPISNHYLGNQKEIAKKINGVKNQTNH